MSRRVNVEKMRRQARRTAERSEMQARAAWLASLTPEHRAIHAGPLGFMCRECLNRSAAAAGEQMGRILASMHARSAPTTPEDAAEGRKP